LSVPGTKESVEDFIIALKQASCDRLKEITQFLLDKMEHFYPVINVHFLPREDYMEAFVK
jgi:hypothetical protein